MVTSVTSQGLVGHERSASLQVGALTEELHVLYPLEVAERPALKGTSDKSGVPA